MIDQASKPFIILLDFIHLIIQTFGKFIDGFAQFLEITEAFAFISRIILVIRKFFGDIHHRIDRSADAFRQSISKYEGYCQSHQDKNVKGLFDALADRMAAAGAAFVHPPMTRFAGQPGEQRTMFLRDPAGNALEFKAFADDAMLFAR